MTWIQTWADEDKLLSRSHATWFGATSAVRPSPPTCFFVSQRERPRSPALQQPLAHAGTAARAGAGNGPVANGAGLGLSAGLGLREQTLGKLRREIGVVLLILVKCSGSGSF